MRWKIVGSNQTTGQAWQLIILAPDAKDAAAQAKGMGLTVVAPMEAADSGPEMPGKASTWKQVLMVLIFPMVLIALTLKAILSAAYRLRRMIISE